MKRYIIEYWEDENCREEGIGEFYSDEYSNFKDAKEMAKKLVDKHNVASVEVELSIEFSISEDINLHHRDDIVFWGYDGIDTWGEIEEVKEKTGCSEEEAIIELEHKYLLGYKYLTDDCDLELGE